MSRKAPRRLIDDCFLTDKERLTHEEALDILRERLSPVADLEPVPLAEATGRVAADAVLAPRPVPAADNAAVDGYAFALADYEATGGFFPVAGRVPAGHPTSEKLPIGAAARIFTGAVMPPRADTVAMQEDCEPHEQDGQDFVIIPPGLKQGANRRRAGEDLAQGTALFDAGQILRSQDVAAAASVGTAAITCYEPLKVAIVSTGDEVLEPGSTFRDGAVYDANRPLLQGLLAGLPVEVTDLGILPDRRDEVQETLRAAAETHHAILTTGGASRGEEDHIVSTLDEIGSRHMWQLAIKPGRPMTFGQLGDCVFLGLPGNPVAAFVCFRLYVRPALLRLAGADWAEPRRVMLKAEFDIRSKPDRREFLRGILLTENGTVTGVDKFDRDGSGLITGLREADGLIEIPEATTEVKEGDEVAFLSWGELGG
ncbi:gephyrin-like molybdotransferase Glp [Lutibaculum baratangense]|uniref:Molybdopterin molybdenumtransferase n=1 Tax=Lutibaculum baratangense AMV1 TaxID=631454 RepID=V4R458_9HYPH|nr:gephyrin-like molybdotransferase Glp [Lutibaculum baratangense]ESR26742.1 Molybdopterin biosynthesis protein MoeA [Lutibaculum baratangense AMV1]